MKSFVTQPHSFKFTQFSTVILFCLIISLGIDAQASTITTNPAANIKLTTATLGATILPAGSVVSERGIIWSTTSGVTITNHKIPEGGLTGGTYSVAITGLDRSQKIYYKGYFTDVNGTFLSDESSFLNVPVFSGTGNWDEFARWSVLEVPGLVDGDSPIIDGICTIANNSPTGNWVCSDLKINPAAKLIINPGRILNVKGMLVNNATETGLVIKSDAINSTGTLTFVKGTPLATVEMYSKASWDLHQAIGSKYSWQFFGIPVKTFDLTNAVLDNCLVRKYNESSIDDSGLWTAPSDILPLTSGTGYEIVQQSPKIYEFTGQITNADITYSLNYNAGTLFPGQNIYSNPYTAAIDIKAIVFGPNSEKSVYLYNTGTYNQWLDNTGIPSDGTTSAPGQYVVSTPSTAGTSGVPAQIPSMQGFLIKLLNQTSSTVTIPYLTATTGNTEVQRAPGFKVGAVTNKVVTRIDLSGSHFADCMWLFSDPACTTKFDNGWDGYKIKGSAQTPQLYAMESDGDYQIDALADVNGTYLGFIPGDETNYKLKFTHTNTDTQYTGLYLVDLIENKTIDITPNGTEYAFTANSVTSTTKRFQIITNSEINTKTPIVKSLLKVFYTNGALIVQNMSNQNGEIVLYTLNGVAVKKMTFKANGITTISTSGFVSGAYVAKASSTLEAVTERVIIR